jgi:hypothetical protein
MMRHVLWLLAVPSMLPAQAPCRTTHLTIFDSNLAQFLEERTLDLEKGSNAVEWRGLMPQAFVRGIRVVAEDGVTVARQDVTWDGPDVRGQKTAVLHLTLQNSGSRAAKKVQVDYLAPGLSWKSDYSLLMGPRTNDEPGGQMRFDGWVTVQNDTGADVCAGTVDLVSGEVQLLFSGASAQNRFTANAQNAFSGRDAAASGDVLAEVAKVSVFSRFRLGRNIAMTANAPVGRFPLFQGFALPLEERNVFENGAGDQTLGRGGFTMAPRGLEVRLVSRNQSQSPFPAGLVTMYQQDAGIAQVVGQDHIPETPADADFSVTEGRSNGLQGTRRVLERKSVPDSSAVNRSKLVTEVEVVITNHGTRPAAVFVREGVERGDFTVTESTHPHRKLGGGMLEFRPTVAARGSLRIQYTVECR